MANDLGGKTLEMTRLGMYLERTNTSYQAWNIASQNFTNQVTSGKPVFVLQNLLGVYIYGTWATTEFPILVKKAIDIICEVIGGAF